MKNCDSVTACFKKPIEMKSEYRFWLDVDKGINIFYFDFNLLAQPNSLVTWWSDNVLIHFVQDHVDRADFILDWQGDKTIGSPVAQNRRFAFSIVGLKHRMEMTCKVEKKYETPGTFNASVYLKNKPDNKLYLTSSQVVDGKPKVLVS